MRSFHLHLEREILKPGDTLSGRVSWNLVAEQSSKLRISVLWCTEGKGSVDKQTVDGMVIPDPAQTGSQSFRFTLPAFPWTFSGELISVVWTVEAQMEDTNMIAGQIFVMAPDGRERIIQSLTDAERRASAQ